MTWEAASRAMYCNPLIFLTEIGEAASKRCHLRETGRIGRRPPGVGGQLVTWGPTTAAVLSSMYNPQPILDCAPLPMNMTKALIHWQCCNLLEKPAGQQSQPWLWRMSTQNSWMTFTLCIQLVLSTVCIQCTLHYFSLIFLWPLSTQKDSSLEERLSLKRSSLKKETASKHPPTDFKMGMSLLVRWI